MGQRGGQGRAAGWLVAMVMMVASLTGCGQGAVVAPSDATVTGRVDVPWGASDAGSDAADAADASTGFPCPEGWVASEHGGCGGRGRSRRSTARCLIASTWRPS